MTPEHPIPSAKTLAVATALRRAGVPYAVGGAIAYFFHGEPRGTVDIDINIFLPDTAPGAALAALRDLGVEFDEARVIAEILRTGQARIDWDGTFVDLFFSYAPFHASVGGRTRRVAFLGDEIDVLSAEDLVVFKVLFNRKKDWLDIEQLLYVQGTRFDLDYAVGWLEAMLGADDARIARLNELAHEAREWAAAEPDA